MDNLGEFNADVLQQLGTTKDADGLNELRQHLSAENEFERALEIKISRWLEKAPATGAAFEAHQFISADLTSIFYGLSPVIFMGTNQWAIKRGKSFDFLESKVDYFCHRIRTVAMNSDAKFSFVVIPEKDLVMDKIAKRNHLFQDMDFALRKLEATCRDVGQGFVYDAFVNEYPDWVSEDDYDYPDSHLLSRDYVSIFRKIIDSFQINSSDVIGLFKMTFCTHYGDLNNKFERELEAARRMIFPVFDVNDTVLTSGSITFENPLSNTVQRISNPTAPIDAKLAIYGDSHSSILSQRRLSYMLSTVFRQCSFHWTPWGGVPEDFSTDADFVVMEMSQRFVFT